MKEIQQNTPLENAMIQKEEAMYSLYFTIHSCKYWYYFFLIILISGFANKAYPRILEKSFTPCLEQVTL